MAVAAGGADSYNGGSGDLATVVSAGGRSARVETEVLTDEDLVLAFQAGSCSAFAEIYRRHRGSAEAVCRRYLHQVDVEDAVQETMLRALQGLTQFNGDYAVRAWINRIATNVCLDALRKRRRRTREQWLESVTGDEPVMVDPSETVESVLEAEDVGAAFARLPDRQQRALFLRGVHGQSHAQIAATLGISAAQVKSIIHRARLALQRDRSRKGWGRGPLVLLPWGRNRELGGIFGRFRQLTEPMAGTASSPAFMSSVSDGYSVLATAAVATVATVVGTVVGTGTDVLSAELRDPDGPAGQVSLVDDSVDATGSPSEVLVSTLTGERASGGAASHQFVELGASPADLSRVTACEPEVERTAKQKRVLGSQCSSRSPSHGSRPSGAPPTPEVVSLEPRTAVTDDVPPLPESSPVPRLSAPAVKSVPRSAPSLPAAARPPVAGVRRDVSAAATRRTVAPPRPELSAPTEAPVAKPPPAGSTVAIVPADVPETDADASTGVPSLTTP